MRGRDTPLRRRRREPIAAVIAAMLPALAASAVHADVSVRAQLSTQRAVVGQQLTLSIEVNGAQNVQAPALGGLDAFDAQYVGPSTQVSIVNGQMSATVQHRYALTPRREGQFTLGPFTIEYEGQPYSTAPLSLAVGKAPPAAPAPGGGASDGEQIRLAITTAKTEVYLHEPLPIEVTLYVGSTQVTDVNYPTVAAEGLSLETFGQPRQFGQMIEGRRWDVVQFQTRVIPLQAGERLIGPAHLRLNVVERRRQGGMFNDPFFNAFASSRRPAEIHSLPVHLNVLPLPEEGRPATFNGAVGRFDMQVSASPTELRAGDPVTLKIAIHGDGNLADAKPPALADTAGFKVYDAQVANPEGGALRVFEQVLIPNDASVTAVPPVEFSYFDPGERAYRSIRSDPVALAVRPPEGVQQTRILGVEGEQRVVREQLGRDIVYIKDDLGAVRSTSAPWYGGWPFVLWQPVPIALLAAAAVYERRRRRLTGDVRYARFAQAGRNAKAGLAQAAAALRRSASAEFYDRLSRTVQAYLADKLGLPPGAVDPSAIAEHGVSEDTARRVRELLEACEHIRFAPTAAEGDMRGALSAATEVIQRLERECTNAPAASPVQ